MAGGTLSEETARERYAKWWEQSKREPSQGKAGVNG